MYFENKLTDEERATLDLSDSDILVQFIRNKYQAKKWVSDILLAPAQTTESILPIPEKSIYSQHEQQVTSEKQPTLATDTTVSPKLPVLHDNLTDMIRMNPLKPISNLNSKVKINSTNNKYLLNNRSQDGFVKRSIYKLYASSE